MCVCVCVCVCVWGAFGIDWRIFMSPYFLNGLMYSLNNKDVGIMKIKVVMNVTSHLGKESLLILKKRGFCWISWHYDCFSMLWNTVKVVNVTWTTVIVTRKSCPAGRDSAFARRNSSKIAGLVDGISKQGNTVVSKRYGCGSHHNEPRSELGPLLPLVQKAKTENSVSRG